MEAKPLQTAAILRTLFLCVLIMFVAFPSPRKPWYNAVLSAHHSFVAAIPPGQLLGPINTGTPLTNRLSPGNAGVDLLPGRLLLALHRETISTGFVESAINQVVSKRMVKKQQMRWTERGARLLLQVRTRVLNQEWRSTLSRLYA